MTRLESAVRSIRDSVVLPAPDGDESTSMSPRRRASIALPDGLFDILGLLSKLVDDRLEAKTDAREFDVRRLGTKRIGLAIELLCEKVEFSAGRLLGVDKRASFRNMGMN